MVDQLIRATAANGGIRAVGVITTCLTQEARDRHRLSYVATAALGRAMAGGLLLASNMKRPQSRVNLRVRGDGPLGGLLVDAGLDGTVRGYVNHPEVELPLNAQGKLDVGGAIGNGFLYVLRDIGYGYPYSSTVELVSGEIGEDITHYLATSEQTPSALMLGVFLDRDAVQAAGGLLIQILPKAANDDSLVEVLESRIGALSSFTTMLRSGMTLQDMMREVMGDLGLEIFPETQLVKFYCPCSHDRVLSALKIMGAAELEDMIAKDETAEANCHFCNTTYHAPPSQLETLLAELRSEMAETGS
ncbi:MAG: Hsp33 family molecular chaperone HslO [Synechococcales bacterium]|nr:Hsp33 family molecular chaperone HslO [Synechococcales bacterium]